MDNGSRSYSKRAEDVLLGVTKGIYDNLIDDRSNPLVYAFLLFLSLKNLEIERIDEAALKDCDDTVDYLARSQNVLADYFILEPDWIKYDVGDFIGFTEEENKPVIVRKGHLGYRVLDPETGEERKYDAKTIHLSESALYIVPLTGQDTKSGMNLMLKAIVSQKSDLAYFALMTVITAMLSICIPVGIKQVIDKFIYIGDISNLMYVGISLSLTIFAMLLINIVINRSKVRLQANSRRQIVATVMSKLMAINVGDENVIQEELIATYMSYINSIDVAIDSILSCLVYAVQTIVMFAVASGNSKIHSKILGPVLFITIALYALLIGVSYKTTIEKRKTETSLKMTKKEMMGNVETIKNYNIAEKIYYRFAVAYDSNVEKSILLNNIGQWNGLLLTLFSEFAMLLLFVRESVIKTGDLGEISSVASSISIIVGYLGMLFVSASSLINNIPYQKLADKILGFENEGESGQGYTGEVTGAIEFTNVSFAYSDGANTVINNLNLKIEPGEYIGIVGVSGCGKSTLIKLLMGFLKPTSGIISYDGVDINHYDLQCLRKQFGVVMQNAEVISGSIKSNIGMGSNPDMDKVEQAAKKANIYDDIMAMPMQFNTILSSEAEVVSGGQRQRIVLARALLNDPKILILDEATSAMDNITQANLKKNLNEMKITRIVVAHRLSTIEDCDRILVLDKGSIVESGTYSELMNNKGLFYSMASRNLA